MRVLVVDDEELVCRAVERALTLQDFEVRFFTSSLEALEIAEKETFDVILLDIMMPHMDGVTLCERLRKLTHLANAPIIIISARAEDAIIVSAMDRGADDYIVKPFKASDLVNKINILFEKAKKGNLPSRFYSQRILSEEKKEEDEEGTIG